MKIVLLDPTQPLIHRGSLQVGQKTVGVGQLLFVPTANDMSVISGQCKWIWNTTWAMRNRPKFKGLVRFDGIPCVENLNPRCVSDYGFGNVYDVGALVYKGLYENNGMGPEGVPGIKAVQQAYPELAQYQPDVVAQLVASIKKTIGDDPIYFVAADKAAPGTLKYHWSTMYFEALRNAGLNIKWLTPEQTMKTKGGYIFAWGDMRKGYAHSEFNDLFVAWCFANAHRVLNTPLTAEQDVFDKGLLMPDGDAAWNAFVGDNTLLNTTDDVERIMKNPKQGVLKPRSGGSGRGIEFRNSYSESNFRSLLTSKVGKGFAAYERRDLPTVNLGDSGSISFDANAAFWVDTEKKLFEQVHIIVRLTSGEAYAADPIMNVGKTAGLGGAAVPEAFLKSISTRTAIAV